jgi:hypothetical protein
MIAFMAELAFYFGIIPALYGLAIARNCERWKGWPLWY